MAVGVTAAAAGPSVACYLLGSGGWEAVGPPFLVAGAWNYSVGPAGVARNTNYTLVVDGMELGATDLV